jgi:hypothetical protein
MHLIIDLGVDAMAERAGRDWIDISAKLLIPVVIAGGGTWFTWHKDRSDQRQRQWERDSGYIKLLASTNEQERSLGLRIIEVLQNEGQFSPELGPVVKAVASEHRPSDPSSQTAVRILSNAGLGQASAGTQATAPRPVYIQIGHEEQHDRAVLLEIALRKMGYTTPALEQVAHPTFHTFIRYFSKDTKADAERIQEQMTHLGFAPEIQDYSNSGQLGSDGLEIWFGDKEPATVGGGS